MQNPGQESGRFRRSIASARIAEMSGTPLSKSLIPVSTAISRTKYDQVLKRNQSLAKENTNLRELVRRYRDEIDSSKEKIVNTTQQKIRTELQRALNVLKEEGGRLGHSFSVITNALETCRQNIAVIELRAIEEQESELLYGEDLQPIRMTEEDRDMRRRSSLNRIQEEFHQRCDLSAIAEERASMASLRSSILQVLDQHTGVVPAPERHDPVPLPLESTKTDAMEVDARQFNDSITDSSQSDPIAEPSKEEASLTLEEEIPKRSLRARTNVKSLHISPEPKMIKKPRAKKVTQKKEKEIEHASTETETPDMSGVTAVETKIASEVAPVPVVQTAVAKEVPVVKAASKKKTTSVPVAETEKNENQAPKAKKARKAPQKKAKK